MDMKVAFLLVALTISCAGCDAFGSGWGPEPVQQHSGYIDVNNATGHIFFWMFESRSEPSKDPLVLWMTGGPGCSSEIAIFYEQGPYRISESGKITKNEYAWNSHANVIFVDQPLGTGFSYSDDDEYVTNEKQVAQDMYEFLQGFYKSFPQYKKHDFFVTGESYGGHYVPAVSNRIYYGNKNKEGFNIPLKGIAIGNGMVNAQRQYPDYIKYAEMKKLITDQSVLEEIQKESDTCEQEMKIDLQEAQDQCNTLVGSIIQYGGNFNVYDVREPCKVQPLCYDFSPLDAIMKRPEVQKQLGVSDKATWTECSSKVGQYLSADWFTKSDLNLPVLLENGIDILVYSGVEDFICNYLGGLDWMSHMEWSGQSKINAKKMTTWKVDNKVAGRFKSEAHLTFLEVDAAGHMVPMNQPKVALHMLETLMAGNAFCGGDDALPSERLPSNYRDEYLAESM